MAATLSMCAAIGRTLGDADPGSNAALERTSSLIQARQFHQAAAELRELLSTNPGNRRAKELLAFALESCGDLDGERQVRSSLAAEFPGDARVRADLGRVLERSGDYRQALEAYRTARRLGAEELDPGLDAAIERMRGRTAVELAAPVGAFSDPDATATRVGAGAAVPFRSLNHLALRAERLSAEARTGPGATTSDQVALSLVLGRPSGASLMMGPRLHVVSNEENGQTDLAVGGEVGGRGAISTWLEGEGRGEFEAPWSESAVTVLHGGRSTGARGLLYAHMFDRRLIFQAGAVGRRLSILTADADSAGRPDATQSLLVGGVDMVVWRKPGAAIRGEMLDETLIAPVTASPSLTLGYRHYESNANPTPEFASIIGLAPRGSVDEASASFAVTAAQGRFGLGLRAGLGHDSVRQVRMWRGGGELFWAPKARIRFGLGYEGATESATGLTGRRDAGWMSIHVDL